MRRRSRRFSGADSQREPRSASRRPRLASALLVAAIVAGAIVVVVRTVHADPECTPSKAGLRIAASSEKAELLRQMAAGYSRKGCGTVTVTTMASGAALDALADGWTRADGPPPDVWSPAASGWLTLLRQRSRSAPIPAEAPSIVKTPLVIAMPEPMATALGWPEKALGWADVLDLASSEQGWARHGHPEWGPFRLGKTHPGFSTSGLNATIGAYVAATRVSGDLTTRDVASPKVRRFVQGVERSIVHYGDTTLTFLSNLQRADDAGAAMSYISAVTVEEKSVWDYNEGNPTGDPATRGQHDRPDVPLVAIHPKEGTLLSDNPYAVLKWASPAKRKVAADFLAYLRAPAQQRRFAEHGFRALDDPLPVKILQVPAPKVLDAVLASWAELRKPANVLMVMDVSGSMEAAASRTGRSKLALAQSAARRAVGDFGPRDRVGLWSFSTKWTELVPMATGNRDDLRAEIDRLRPQGATGLHETALAAYRHVQDQARSDTIDAVVLLTDGRDEVQQTITLDHLLKGLRGPQPVRVFTIAYGADADLGTLKTISETTRAASYDSRDPGVIDRIFTEVIANF
ncbi:substrate-binding and VWA domain-containing protein [Herbidospora sp. NBRC 101105]|uniref:substrate-binding and VWA domain-containing protein n=1 Tax=Herbidospora sp. NBRC 101105 TaxID=3032195 RepID=UPI0025541BC9|nr:substrate-binding and VWA domain-containing protein [Herbidospora sp. NBRC 101105]